jgi:hypothetical protein
LGSHRKKIEFTGSITPKNRQKVGVVYGFPAELGESIKTHISVKSRDIDTKFESWVETKAYTLDFGSNVTYHQIQDGGSRHFFLNQTNNLVNFLLISMNFKSRSVTSYESKKMQNRK